MTTDLVLSLFIAGINHANELGNLYQQCKAENRDPTDAEMQAVFDKDSVARAKLTLDIAAAKAAGK